MSPLPRSFYERDTVRVARELLGKLLVVRSRDGVCTGRIVETEAYSENDPASHSAKGPTRRAAIMFGEPGVAYVYFIYGMYEMLNFVTEPEGRAGAVLIRALEPLPGGAGGEALLHAARRQATGSPARLTRGSGGPWLARRWHPGPGKLCRALGIELAHNGASLSGPILRVVDDGSSPSEISVSPRVGISIAKEKPWRFFIAGNACVSRAPQNAQAKRWRAPRGTVA